MSFDWYSPIFDHIGESFPTLKEIYNPKGIMYFVDRSYLKRKLVRKRK